MISNIILKSIELPDIHTSIKQGSQGHDVGVYSVFYSFHVIPFSWPADSLLWRWYPSKP